MDSPYSAQRVRRKENKGGKGSKEEKKSSPFLCQSHDKMPWFDTKVRVEEGVQSHGCFHKCGRAHDQVCEVRILHLNHGMSF